MSKDGNWLMRFATAHCVNGVVASAAAIVDCGPQPRLRKRKRVTGKPSAIALRSRGLLAS